MKDNKTETVSTDSVPFIVFESEMTRLERVIDKLWVLLLIVFAALVISNVCWIYYESQYIDEVTETVETSTEGGGNAYGTLISGDNSEVHYGEGNSNTD